MRLVYSFNYYENLDKFKELFEISKNLYNQANFIIRQEFFKTGKYLNYNEMDRRMKNVVNKEGTINYKLLKAETSQQCLMELDKSWKSYFVLIKKWAKNPKSLNGKPKIPGYKKSAMNHIIFTMINIKDGIIQLYKNKGKQLSIKIPKFKDVNFSKCHKQIRIHPTKFGYVKVEIIYEQEIINNDLDKDKFASIDLGINNLVTMVSSHEKPIIFNGKPVKSINQLYNKRKSKLCSIKDKMKIKPYTTQLDNIENERFISIKDCMHKTSRYITNYLLKNKIHKLVIGYNKGWKCKVDMGKKSNQKFVQIPFTILLQQLQYKCDLVGINLVITEESYTSKIDSLALEKLGKNDLYLGKRVKRGLFQSSVGKIINADVNGALNILRKVIDDSVAKQIIDRGFLLNPIKIRNCFSLNSLYKEITA